MSDDGSPVVEDKKKRGRPSKSPVKEAKRRGRPPAEKNNVVAKSDDEDDTPAPVKRGRGRPKGTNKKKGSAVKVAAPPSGRPRGRPKKVEEKPESTGEEEDEQEEEEEEN
ncbi:high mobility group protein HMG-I/HMG-Y [Athalia rosae]|uniref:high mobility group protein HMG-I/HMG-Y n=1 Tax=Athalia rosae TaxID=37344 RepID=UPI000626D365|nr:high mobility group protein HMG-I/HMG-Y [Athalia rosae]